MRHSYSYPIKKKESKECIYESITLLQLEYVRYESVDIDYINRRVPWASEKSLFANFCKDSKMTNNLIFWSRDHVIRNLSLYDNIIFDILFFFFFLENVIVHARFIDNRFVAFSCMPFVDRSIEREIQAFVKNWNFERSVHQTSSNKVNN